MTGDAVSVVLADDDVLVREGISSVLQRSGFVVAAQAGNATELVSLVREHRPGMAIVDIRMPPTHTNEGLVAAKTIRAELPGVAVLVLSAHVEVDEALELLADGGAVGYLLKSRVTDVAEFVANVGRVARGGSVVDTALVGELFSSRRRGDPLDVLTRREREVLGLMAEGYSNSGIASRLFVNEGTVEKHVHNILPKLQIPESEEGHRRVLAVLSFLEAR
jgi:DNA-binding NarL/FixJ family response regulator